MNLYGYIKKIFEARTANRGSDFSKFAQAAPLTRKQQLIEECMKQNVSIYIDDPFERSVIFQMVASEGELERRLNAKKVIALSERAHTHSMYANLIAFAALIATTIALLNPIL